MGYRVTVGTHAIFSALRPISISPAQEKWLKSSLALHIGRDISGSDELSDLRAVLDRVSHGSRQDPGVWLAVVAVSRG